MRLAQMSQNTHLTLSRLIGIHIAQSKVVVSGFGSATLTLSVILQ